MGIEDEHPRRCAISFDTASQASEFRDALNIYVGSRVKLERDRMFPGVRVHGYSHGRSFISLPEQSNAWDTSSEIVSHTTEFTLSYEEVAENRLEALVTYIDKLTEYFAEAYVRDMYRVVEESTSRYGNVVTAGGEGFDPELFIEMLEKIEFGVDENGRPTLPSFHASPEMMHEIAKSLSNQDAEFEARVNATIERKCREALEREKQRLKKFPAPVSSVK